MIIREQTQLGVFVTREYAYGEMNLVTENFRWGNLFTKFELGLGGQKIDFCNLPLHDGARRIDRPEPLVGTMKSGEAMYDPRVHTIRFAEKAMSYRTFPFIALEELFHARSVPRVNGALALAKDFGLTYPLNRLPTNIQLFISEQKEGLAGINELRWNRSDLQEKPGLAWLLAHEYTAKREALRSLYAWCGGDVRRVGLDDSEVVEGMALSLVRKARSFSELPYFTPCILDMPRVGEFSELQELMDRRLEVINRGNSMNFAGSTVRSFLSGRDADGFLREIGVT